MSDLTKMLTEIKSLLLENKLEDLTNYFKIGDTILINTGNGPVKKYEVKGKVMIIKGRKAIPVISDTKEPLVIDIASYDGKKVIIYKPNPNTQGFSVRSASLIGMAVTMPAYRINSKNIEDIDVSNMNNQSSTQTTNDDQSDTQTTNDGDPIIDEYEGMLTTLDILEVGYTFSIESHSLKPNTIRGDKQFETNDFIIFNVRSINDNLIDARYVSSNGNNENKYYSKLSDIAIIIDKDKSGSLKILEKDIKLVLKLGDGSFIIIPGVFDIEIKHDEKGVPTTDEEAPEDDLPTIGHDELMDMIKKDPGLANLYRKNETIGDTLRNASPVGVFQLLQILNKEKVKNGYFTKGNHVYFKLLTEDLQSVETRDSKLISRREEPYVGIFYDSKTFLIGAVHQKHWEIKLLNKRGDSDFKYDAEITYYYNRNKHDKPHSSIIEITDLKIR